MRFYLLILFSFTTVLSDAQSGYNLTYKLWYDSSFNIIGSKVNTSVGYNRLVFNDSMSFAYGLWDGKKDPMRTNKSYGTKMFSHSVIFDRNRRMYYRGFAYPAGSKEYLVSDTLAKKEWLYSNDTKIIGGYECQKACFVNEYRDGSDSTFVWYTKKIPLPFGPLDYFGFPGLVLEVIEQGKQGLHICMETFQQDAFLIVFPKKYKIITKQDFIKLKEKYN